MHAWEDTWKLATGTWTSQRKCWKKHSSGERLTSQRRFAGWAPLIFFISLGSLIVEVIHMIRPAWSRHWKRNREIVQSKFSWSRGKDNYSDETSKTGSSINYICTHCCMCKNRVLTVFRLQNTSSHDNQLRHLVYVLENAILSLPEDQEEMVCLIDFTGWSLSNSPIKTARETANILQCHYPERLAVGFLYNPPRIFETFWKVLISLSNELPRNKLKQNKTKQNKRTINMFLLIGRWWNISWIPKPF